MIKLEYYSHSWAVNACKRLADDMVHFEFKPQNDELCIYTDGYDMSRLGDDMEGYEYVQK